MASTPFSAISCLPAFPAASVTAHASPSASAPSWRALDLSEWAMPATSGMFPSLRLLDHFGEPLLRELEERLHHHGEHLVAAHAPEHVERGLGVVGNLDMA